MNDKIRSDFPLLDERRQDQRRRGPLVYFDNACMALKPRQVIEAMQSYYQEFPACGGRSGHRLSRQVDDEVDAARRQVAKFISARRQEECVFTRNTTEGINMVAHGIGLKQGDEVIISGKEHNSNLIPWLRLRQEQGICVKVLPVDSIGTLDMAALESAITKKTRLVSMVHTSNLDGVTNPLRDIAKIAHDHGAKVLADGAQSVPSHPVDVRHLGVDFLSCSGHKLCGPTGTGILYGSMEALEQLRQYNVGGETVIDSTYDTFTPEELPMRLEAGLQDYAGIIGLGAAVKYLSRIGMQRIERQELALNKVMTEGLRDLQIQAGRDRQEEGSLEKEEGSPKRMKKIRLIGPQDPALRSGIYNFTVDTMDAHHVAKMLDVSDSIMVRSGAHCVHSWFNANSIKGSVRASMYFYNTLAEAEHFVDAMGRILTL